MSDYSPIDELNERLALFLRTGFYTPQYALQIALEVAEEFEGSEDDAKELLDKQLELIRQEQVSWPSVTDCDRLDAAFDQLEQQGIVARHNFTCCGTCGSTEIWDEMKDAKYANQALKGYVFYHAQDTERAVEGGGVYFNYGATEGHTSDDTAALLVQALKDNGLQPDWNGSTKTRVFVPLLWQRQVLSA